ncbi:MAG: molybdopterin synthase sulfur carrier subunit [Gammaproteobacteria bacterium]|nr:molybdopterin synthase sulfur carrier subunit [Gammaproteobacteria bacterium]
MAFITVRVPSLLVPVTGTRSFIVEASTVGGAIEALLDAQPGLKVHLFDEQRELRPHVRIFWNDTDTAWLGDLDNPVAKGDTLTIMQAVSGG